MKRKSRFNLNTTGGKVAHIARGMALQGHERPQLNSKELQEISDRAFNEALEDWAEANANGELK